VRHLVVGKLILMRGLEYFKKEECW